MDHVLLLADILKKCQTVSSCERVMSS